jgi:hypothetical protein
MRTVTQFPTEAAMLTDVCQTAMILETAGWRRLHHESDTLIQDTWQHDQHPHDIVIRWTANLVRPHPLGPCHRPGVVAVARQP